ADAFRYSQVADKAALTSSQARYTSYATTASAAIAPTVATAGREIPAMAGINVVLINAASVPSKGMSVPIEDTICPSTIRTGPRAAASPPTVTIIVLSLGSSPASQSANSPIFSATATS